MNRKHRFCKTIWVAICIAAFLSVPCVSFAQTSIVGGGSKAIDTKITIVRGVVLELDATGRVEFEKEGSFGPEGTDTYAERTDYVAPTRHRLGLVARLTPAGLPFDSAVHFDYAFGDGKEVFIPENAPFTEGRLWLSTNGYSAATGEYVVNIAVRLATEEGGRSGFDLSAGTQADATTAAVTGVAAAVTARARYRITGVGYSVNTQTWDDAFNWDGWADEVFMLAEVRVITKDGKTALVSEPMSQVMGDNSGPYGYRVRAGSGKKTGGLITGNRFPTGTPWCRGYWNPWLGRCDNTGPIQADRPAMLLFQGELVKGETAVMISPSIWEWDGSPTFVQGWWNALERNAPAIVSGVLSIWGKGADASKAVREGLEAGLPAVGNLFRGWFGTAGDRMIGMNVFNKSTGTYSGTPKAIVLSYEQAEMLVNTNFGKGPGVLELQYRDHPDIGGGHYTLYVQVERLN